MTFLRTIVLALAAAALVSCGGGGGGINNSVPGVTSFSTTDPQFREQMVVTLEGRNLDMVSQINPSPQGCSQFARSTTEPYVSTATRAYYTCTIGSVGNFAITFTRTSDGVTLARVPFTVAQPPITVSSITHDQPMYSKLMLITVVGTNVDAGISVTPSTNGCAQLFRSTTEPYVSTPTTSYYRCLVRTVGSFTMSFTYGNPAIELGEFDYDVPEPQVTLKVDNDHGVAGDIVLTLEADKAPITVRNFLNYVNNDFYTDTVFHRLVPDFILQGGGYAKPVLVGGTQPTLKPTNAAITLEDDKGLLNLKNTVAMARTGTPNSATSQFFFNLKDNPSLDRVSDTQRGYAVFGRITSGVSVLTAMEAAPCTLWPEFFAGDAANACFPNPNLYIVSATQTR